MRSVGKNQIEKPYPFVYFSSIRSLMELLLCYQDIFSTTTSGLYIQPKVKEFPSCEPICICAQQIFPLLNGCQMDFTIQRHYTRVDLSGGLRGLPHFWKVERPCSWAKALQRRHLQGLGRTYVAGDICSLSTEEWEYSLLLDNVFIVLLM